MSLCWGYHPMPTSTSMARHRSLVAEPSYELRERQSPVILRGVHVKRAEDVGTCMTIQCGIPDGSSRAVPKATGRDSRSGN